MGCNQSTKGATMKKIFSLTLTASPIGLATLAGGIIAVYAICTICGMNVYTSFISGTSELTGNMVGSAALGAFYVIIHMLVTTIAPILMIAAILLKLSEYCQPKRSK